MNRERNCPYPLVYQHQVSGIITHFRKVDSYIYESEHGHLVKLHFLRDKYKYLYNRKMKQTWTTTPNGFNVRVPVQKLVKETV